MKFAISVHSFVDLITNSSSEVFISVTDNTLKSVRAIVEKLLKMNNIDANVDELFSFEISECSVSTERVQSYVNVTPLVKRADLFEVARLLSDLFHTVDATINTRA